MELTTGLNLNACLLAEKTILTTFSISKNKSISVHLLCLSRLGYLKVFFFLNEGFYLHWFASSRR